MSVPTSKLKSRRLRFGLRTAIAAIAAIALTLGVVDYEIREPYRAEQHAAGEMTRLGGYVYMVEDPQGWVTKHISSGLFDTRVAAIVDLSHSRVADDDLSQLKSFHHFGLITLSDTRISDAGLAELRHVVGSRFVDLSRTKVKDTSLLFSGFSFQEQPLGLRLSGNRFAGGRIFPARLNSRCPLQELDLSETDCDDRTLNEFPVDLKLLKLDLSGTNVTDHGLDSLSKLQGLIWLDLTGSKVTPEGVARLQATWKGIRPLKVATGAARFRIPAYVSNRPQK